MSKEPTFDKEFFKVAAPILKELKSYPLDAFPEAPKKQLTTPRGTVYRSSLEPTVRKDIKRCWEK